MIDIRGIDKAALLLALHHCARAKGWSILDDEKLTLEEARQLVAAKGPRLYFDYAKGRALKISLEGDTLFAGIFDRDNGPGAAARAVAIARGSS